MSIHRVVVPVVGIALGAGVIAGVAYATQRAGNQPSPKVVVAESPVSSGQPTDVVTSPSVTPSDAPSPTPPPDTPSQTAPPAPKPDEERRGEFSGSLTGAKELPGDKPAGDQGGVGTALIEINGDEITFGLSWKHIAAPQAAHIHRGPADQNGDVVADLFGSGLPASANAVTGKISAPGVADRIRANPGNYYVNIHTKEFPGGAIRSQLVAVQDVDPKSVLPKKKLVAKADGRQEVPAAGDPDGQATVYIWPWGSCLDYSMRWLGISTPTMAHIHKGAPGVADKIVGPLFNQKLPGTLTGIAGTAEGQDRAAVKRIKANPQNYYANLHNQEFAKGAVRGQLRHR